MIILFFITTTLAHQLYGNYSLKYYYLSINDTDFIIDQHFDGAIIEEDGILSYKTNDAVLVQRFILIQTELNQYCQFNFSEHSFPCYHGVSYQYKQKINNYLGLSELVQSNNQLKLCLAQNGGYMKIGNFNNGDRKIILNQLKDNCDQKQHCLSESLEFRNIVLKGTQLLPSNIWMKAELDFTSAYIYLDNEMLYQFNQNFICSGFFCPSRNDQDGLICYDKDNDTSLDSFYSKFPELEFKFGIQLEQSVYLFPRDYLVTLDDKSYCLPFKNGNGRVVFGQPFFRNKEFLFSDGYLIINYQNCEEETPIDAPTVSLMYRNNTFDVHIFDRVCDVQKIKQKQYIDKSFHLMIIILFSLAYSKLVFDLQYSGSEYLIDLGIGTPEQNIQLVVDTGAPITSFECNEHSTSINYAYCGANKCVFPMQTYDGEFGFSNIANDFITINNTRNKFDFMCNINNQTNLLGVGSQSSFINNLFNIFYSSESQRIFSLHLQQTKGTLTIKANPTQTNVLAMQYDNDSPYFKIDVASIIDDSKNMVFQPKKDIEYEMIVDSGSTLINVDSYLKSQLIKSFTKCEQHALGCPTKIFYQGRECYQYDWYRYGKLENFYDVFPKFSFNFKNGYSYILEPATYLDKLDSKTYCIPFEEYTRNYEGEFKRIFLFGQPFMRNKEFFFDLTSQKIYIETPKVNEEFEWSSLEELKDLTVVQVMQYLVIITIVILLFKYSSQILRWIGNFQLRNNYNPYQK